MAGVIDTVGSFMGVSPGFCASPASPSSEAAPSSVASAVPIRNPQVLQDPLAGFITEYVNTASGQIVTQVPSAIAVAYLRQGLTADGTPKNKLPESVARTA